MTLLTQREAALVLRLSERTLERWRVSGMIPRTQQASAGAGDVPANTSGWRDATPISNPPGTNWVDAIAIADDARQRAELKRKLGG